MPKPPSEATRLRAAKSVLSKTHAAYVQSVRELNMWKERASKAEKECAEWKERFDILLRSNEPS